MSYKYKRTKDRCKAIYSKIKNMANFDFEVSRALERAKTYANYLKDSTIRTSYVILSIIDDKKHNAVKETLEELNVDSSLLIEALKGFIGETVEIKTKKQKKLNYSKELKIILKYAKINPMLFGAKYEASVVDVFMACLEITNESSEILKENSLEINTFKEFAEEVEAEMYKTSFETYDDYEYSYEFVDTGKHSSGKKEQVENIEKYCINMSKLAEDYEFQPCFGRENELNQLYRVLLRAKKSNPLLIGREGVGKTNLVEGLAYNIHKKRVPPKLLGKKVYSLNLNSMIAGTKYRGMFEERLESVLKEIVSNENIILFIDELHNIVGAGNAEGSSDMSNIIKPYISRKGFKIVGATTTDEYKKYIERDKALKRRFGVIQMDEPNIENSIKILNSVKATYEKEHNVKFTDEAIEACVTLSDKYMTYSTLPDKAIDIMDDVSVKKRLENLKNKGVSKLEEKYKAIEQKKKDIIKSKNYDNAEAVKLESARIILDIKKAKAILKKESDEIIEITVDDIKDVIQEATKIPVADNGISIKDLKPKLKSKIIGQDEAIDSIAKTLMINKLNLDDGDKPIGSFMFIGYSGVGKTQVTREATKVLFGDEKFLIRIDCSEYSQPHEVSKLIGAPAGYVGYNEGGILTEAIKRKPFSVILFDEIEKAHPKLFDILLQILGEGRLTDNMGETINFKNTIIVMTSNVGTKKSISNQSSIGFKEKSNEYDKSIVTKELHKKFRPEFINRVDNVIHFNVLSKEALSKILELELEKLIKQVAKHSVKLKISHSVKTYLVNSSFVPENGFRPLKRKLNDEVKILIAEKLLDNPPKTLNLILKEDKILLK